MSMHDPRRDDHAPDPYDAADDTRSPDSDYPPPEGFSPEGGFKGFPRVEPDQPRIEPTPPPPSRRNLWLTLTAIAALTAATVTGIVLLDPSPTDKPTTEESESPAPRPTDPYPDYADDDMVRAQIGDCITFADKDDDESWRVVDCDKKEALGKVYAFAVGTTSGDECPKLPKGTKTRYHYALDYPESNRDDYVVCAADIKKKD